MSPCFLAESIATSPLAWGELVKACVDGEIVEIAVTDPRLEFGADEIADVSGWTWPALIVQHRSVPRPRTRLSSATSRSARRSAFICDEEAGGAVCRSTCANATAGAYASEPVRKVRTREATESRPCSDGVGTTREARKRSAHVPAIDRVKGLARKALACTNELARYHGGRKSGPMAVVS